MRLMTLILVALAALTLNASAGWAQKPSTGEGLEVFSAQALTTADTTATVNSVVVSGY